ncbi:hypothetical protein K402DRAFT_325576 [Aulographum hederae CBS 113979]|uniref:Integral membrane protein n=1 Tax=Aulographum hederae CBS 113979 TaxID=1176131 RepID=A0A6G1HA70_9PEZI|nr:hypothetical protein K402DRAFT_325576 [Aulographum hederae CBS 113979]
MYSRKAWGGAVDPFISIKFMKATGDGDPTISMVMFEWKDEPLIGKSSSEGAEKQFICTDQAISQQLCTKNETMQFILADNAAETSKSQIITQAIHLKEPPSIKYPIQKTGWYCVNTWSSDETEYTAVVEFRNAFGELPAPDIAKLPFYGGLALLYAVIGAFWAFLYVQNRHDILAVQNYITAILIFLVVEMLMTWGYYDYQNRHGINVGTRVLMIIASILNAGRNSFSFFLLLIVCMGYGVVKPSLGKTMIWVRWLAAAHFVFGVIYAIASLTIHAEDAGPLVLLVILPLSATLTAFYVWTLNSLNLTMKDLMERKQTVKALMYKKLWWCILGSILIIFAFFFLNSLSFAGVGDQDFPAAHWQTRWFILDGWLNIVYLADVAFIAYLWRPTANNRRFAMSDEIAQDDDGVFEFAPMGGRDSLDDDLEGAMHTPPDSNNSNAESGSHAAPPAYNRMSTASPLPAPTPKKPASSLPRESLDGDTIFAVGEEDKWSDDEDDSSERKRLTGKSD